MDVTSPETKATLTRCAEEMFPNFDKLSEDDKENARIVAATAIRTFINNWKPSKEIIDFFNWCRLDYGIVMEGLKKIITDMDKEYL